MTLQRLSARILQKNSTSFIKALVWLAANLSWLSQSAALCAALPGALSGAPTPSVKKESGSTYANIPFWKKSEARLRQIREERSIQVSSRREDLASGEMRFTFLGAGDVSKDCDLTLALAQQFDRLPEISDHFKEVILDSERRQVWLVAAAFGYQGRMLMQTDLAPARDPIVLERSPQLNFEITWGTFHGLRGALTFDSLDLKKCEVSVEAHYQTKEPPLPKALMGFALEVVIQKVAEKMRAFAESSSSVDLKRDFKRDRETAKTRSSQALEAKLRQEHLSLTLLRAPVVAPPAAKAK